MSEEQEEGQCGRVRGKPRAVGKGQDKEFRFYFKYNEKWLESFKWETNVIFIA